jgi:hypothetical protein
VAQQFEKMVVGRMEKKLHEFLLRGGGRRVGERVGRNLKLREWIIN